MSILKEIILNKRKEIDYLKNNNYPDMFCTAHYLK